MPKAPSPIQWFPPAETKIPLLALTHLLHSNVQFTTNKICLQINSAHCLLGPNGRALLFNLLAGLYKECGRTRNEVLLPAYTCYSVAAAVVKAGLRIRLYDLNSETFEPITASFEKNCNTNTLAVISQHLMGIPSNVEDIAAVAESEGFSHIEDAAQALGGRFKEKHLGTTGDYGLFSFGRGKPLPLGSGGALISNRINLKELPVAFSYSSGWKALSVTLLSQIIAYPYLYGIAENLPLGLGKTVFDPDFEIKKIPRRLISLLAPMLSCLEKLNKHRLAIASVYQQILPSSHTISYHNAAVPVYPRFPVVAKPGPLPKDLIRIGIRRLYPKSLNQEMPITPYILNLDDKFPGAEHLAERLISLPTHHFIDSKIAEFIGEKIKNWINS
ncbi:MAG: DegT/DnrJ/EryC1/StrS family aminotransferase [Desulfobacteraceae bacterium]|jgi:dTDP-4-amino-4,6-dideoxygalactose transaminase